MKINMQRERQREQERERERRNNYVQRINQLNKSDLELKKQKGEERMEGKK